MNCVCTLVTLTCSILMIHSNVLLVESFWDYCGKTYVPYIYLFMYITSRTHVAHPCWVQNIDGFCAEVACLLVFRGRADSSVMLVVTLVRLQVEPKSGWASAKLPASQHYCTVLETWRLDQELPAVATVVAVPRPAVSRLLWTVAFKEFQIRWIRYKDYAPGASKIRNTTALSRATGWSGLRNVSGLRASLAPNVHLAC